MRYLFCFLIFCSGLSVHAQIAKDTTIDGRPYVIHTVQSQETLYGISREYNAELNQIVVQNPTVIQGLKVGMRILVPLQKSRKEKEKKGSRILNAFKRKTEQLEPAKPNVVVSDTTVLKAALLLPFYLDMNDTLEAHNETNNPTSIYPKSQTAIEYYTGVLMALDTLGSLGINIDLKVFDVSNDSVYDAILDSTVLDDRELIIGPLLANQFKKLANRYGLDTNRRLVSPLSYKNAVAHFSNTYQVMPLPKVQLDTLVDFIKSRYQGESFVIIGQESEASLVKHAKVALLTEPNQIRFKQYIFKSRELPNKELLYDVLDEERNMVLVPSNNRSFVSRVLPILGSMEDTSFTVYGLDSWNRFDNLDMDDLVNLDVHIPSVFFPYPQDVYQDFVLNFHKKNRSYPSKYSFAAYKQILHFASERFSDFFYFKNIKPTRGQLNTAFPIIKYEDYKQHLVE